MSVQIIYKNSTSKKNISNAIFFVDEKFNISNLKKHILGSEYSYLNDLLKTKDFKKKILDFDINSKKKIILVSLKKNLKNSDLENLGAKFYDLFKNSKSIEYELNSDAISNKFKNIVGYFLHGLRLKSYTFEKYITKKRNNKITIIINGKNIPSSKDKIKLNLMP